MCPALGRSNDAAVIGDTTVAAVAQDGQQTAAGTLTITDADAGQAAFRAGTTAGTYGSVALATDGRWTYTLDNAAAQSLKGGKVVSDAITVRSADGTTQVVTLAITGTNDAATIGGTATGTVTEDTQLTASGVLTVSDADSGESSFLAGTIAGSYGALVLGANRQTGGFGADRLTGGAGTDTFRFTDLRDSGDTITDFVHGTDRIDLSAFKVAGANYDFDAPTKAARFSAGHDLIWYYDNGNTIALGNTDDDPNTAEFRLTLAGRVNLSAVDFVL